MQRSRYKWMKEGDANTKYFNHCIKGRAKRNHIKALKVRGLWVQKPFEVREAVVDYFWRHVALEDRDRPRMNGFPFKRLSEEVKNGLVLPFSLIEIEKVVKESDGNKSPEPDGFNFVFTKDFWYLMKDGERIMFDQFYGNSVLPRSLFYSQSRWNFCIEGLPHYISFGMPLQAYLKGVGGTFCYGVEFGHIHVSIGWKRKNLTTNMKTFIQFNIDSVSLHFLFLLWKTNL